MKNIALISNTEIINKIFTLIANKLMVNLKVYKNSNFSQNVDLIIVDDYFLDENIIKLRANCDAIVLLKKNNQPEANFDFIIQKPFLPSALGVMLEKILKQIDYKVINEKHENKEYQTNHKTVYESSEPTYEEIGLDLNSFISNMIDEMDEEKNYNSNDLTVTKEQLGHGGVLDKDELSKLYEMIHDTSDGLQQIENSQENNWVELSEIIDKAIDDLSAYSFKENEPIKLVLNQYSMEELSPLFKKLNQNIVDNLIDGHEITLQLRLKNDK